MLKHWFRYFITIFFSFKTPMGVKEYRLASLFLLITIAVLKVIDFVIVPLFNQTHIRSSTSWEDVGGLFWSDYEPVTSTRSYITNNLQGIVPLIIMICTTAYLILCYKRLLDVKQGNQNFKPNWFFTLPLVLFILSVVYGIHLAPLFLIYYLPIFIAFSFKEFLSSEPSERKEWWGNFITKHPSLENFVHKVNKKFSFLNSKIHYIGYSIAISLFIASIVKDYLRYSNDFYDILRDFLIFMEYFLNPLSIVIFLFYLFDLFRVLYSVDGLNEYKESDNLTQLNESISLFKKELLNSKEVSKTLEELKATKEKSKEAIENSKLKDVAEKVKEKIKKIDD
ncbi:hypothetical protein ROV62_10240 [Pasteurella multocida]|uniref:hypothetical protein n=1 Tax=Pasteurella multocida TaxID=747 RepID=UPI002C268BE0|nr:hypothetical protein [Pasteurella multocida]MEB3504326.1 hypothetical protein [Pasteurella multocida]